MRLVLEQNLYATGELSCGIYQLSELLKNKRERDVRSPSYKLLATSYKMMPSFHL